ncbi:hypothetical protein TKV_c09670 [Thermoanaerobacter kivui]|uniref:Uncharacterized protein n=1 Tax=Thermoanaerobacter kivui TaxID=2325 RepID=A0A097AQN5_THEKI|nr:hypothetical protein [Thermoanaerobacter kivui]AIS52144.1 hypothetical protein TKV_c09670 [Thermoanaerobacter kivui]
MGAEKNLNEELKKLMANINEKIKSDDILNSLLNNDISYVREGESDWKLKYGREIVEIYKKLLKIVDKLSAVSQ